MDETTPKKGGMSAPMIAVIAVVVLVLLGVGYFFVSGNSTPAPTDTSENMMIDETSEESMMEEDQMMEDEMADGNVVEVAVQNQGFTFTPDEITAKVGDTVRVTFTSSGGTHDFRIDEFNTGTQVLNSGESETVEFVVDQAGEFEFYCSVGNHRQMGMVGTLTVTE